MTDREYVDALLIELGWAAALPPDQFQTARCLALACIRTAGREAARKTFADAALDSGTTYDLTCNIADYTDAASLDAWLTAGNLVRVLEKDVTSPTSHDATIVSFPSATVVRLLFTGAFVIGTSEWSLGLRDAGSYGSTAPLARFMFQAGPDRRIGHSDFDVDARVFSP